GLQPHRYGVVTLHRPATVDNAETLVSVVDALRQVARQIPLVFPVHPRTRRRLEAANGGAGAGQSGGAGDATKGIRWLEPLGDLDFIALVSRAAMVLTDSGGLQEETTALGVPCLTVRDRTERPVTVTHGTNRIVGTAPVRIVEEAFRTLEEPRRTWRRPYLWDGRAARRIVAILRGATPASPGSPEPSTGARSNDG